jgi:predicted RNase H-like nuclease (RuvC/YqgF family)
MVPWPIPRLEPPWLFWLTLAALGLVIACVGFLVVRWLVRRSKPPRKASGPSDAAAVKGEDTMTPVESMEVHRQLGRWLEEAQAKAAVLQSVFNDLERFRERAEAAERRVHETDLLRQRIEATEGQCEQLRQELDRNRTHLQKLWNEREELLQQLSQILLRLLQKSP